MKPTDYARDRFNEEIEAAKEHFGRFSVHWEVAQLLAERYGFSLPDVMQAVQVESSTGTNGTGRAVKTKPPTMPKMIEEYFEVHQQVAEPKDVDAWVRSTYPQAKNKRYAIGQTLFRMRKEGRVYAYKYVDRQSAQYGLPAWKREGYHHGFEPEYLPESLRSEVQLEFTQQGSGQSAR